MDTQEKRDAHWNQVKAKEETHQDTLKGQVKQWNTAYGVDGWDGWMDGCGLACIKGKKYTNSALDDRQLTNAPTPLLTCTWDNQLGIKDLSFPINHPQNYHLITLQL